MKTLLFSIITFFFLVNVTNLYAQGTSINSFEKVTAQTFYLPDSAWLQEADAVIISDKGKCEFSCTKSGDLMLSYTRRVRTKILKVSGYKAASFELRLTGDVADDETEITAVTYNNDSGVIK